MKDFNECPIGEYIRVIKLLDNPPETLTNEELWVLYTKAKDDELRGFPNSYKRTFENELVNRGILTTSQSSIFEGEII